jgi:hypothetical protein
MATTLIDLKLVLKGGPGSGHHGHGGRPGKRGGSSPGKGGGIRVWTGQRETWEGDKISKLETGEIGERIAAKALADEFGEDFQTMNEGINNAPIDIFGDHVAAEVKTGLTTNGKDAQKWRATIGQPGKSERALLKQMGKDEKREHNRRKRKMIMERKRTMLDKISKETGKQVKGMTVGIIMTPDGKRGDVYMIPGFHSNLRWNKYATDEYFAGSYEP